MLGRGGRGGVSEHPLDLHPLARPRTPARPSGADAPTSPSARARPRARVSSPPRRARPRRNAAAPVPVPAEEGGERGWRRARGRVGDPLLGARGGGGEGEGEGEEKRSPPYSTPLALIFGEDGGGGEGGELEGDADGGGGGGGGEGVDEGEGALGGESQPVAVGALDPSHVSVVETQEDHAAGHSVYTVCTRNPVASSADEVTFRLVRRALSDFTWLEQTLRERYEAVIVPSLPPMALAGRLQYGYAYDFERRRGLEKFLRRVVAHTVLATVEEVLAFLGVLGEEAWKAARTDASRHQSVIASALFGRRAADDDDLNTMQWLSKWGSYKWWQTGRWVGKGVAALLERDNPAQARRKEDTPEARLARLKAYVDDLGTWLARLRLAASRASQARAEHVRADDALQEVLLAFGEKEGGQFGRLLHSTRETAVGHDSVQQSLALILAPALGGAAKPTSPRGIPAGATFLATSPNVSPRDGLAPDPTLTTARFYKLSSASGDPGPSSLPVEGDGGAGNPGGAYARPASAMVRMASQTDGLTTLTTLSSNRSDVEESAPPSLVPSAGHQTASGQQLAEVLREFEQRADGAKRIMNARLDEQEAYEHASEVYTRLRDKMEARTGSMWGSLVQEDDVSLELARGHGVEELYKSMTAAAATLAHARKQYHDVALATTDELRRLRGELHVETAAALRAVAAENAQHHALRAARWAALATQCDAYAAASAGRSGSGALRRNASSTASDGGGAFGDLEKQPR